LSCWTNNGQNIFLEISFFARFLTPHTPAKIRDFFFNFGDGRSWKNYFVRSAYAKIKEITTDFQELDFYQER